MQEVTKYPDATFGWVDLSTPDVAAAKSFYTQLFGWEADDRPLPDGGVYVMLKLNGKNVAGLGPMQGGTDANHPAYWSSYLIVEDIESSVEKAQSAGATVTVPPMDVMEEGRMAILQDPTEAFFGMWQPGNHGGAQLVNIPGSLCWNELYTRDPERVKTFYQDALGWTADSDGGGYLYFRNGERMAAGVMTMDEEMAGMPPMWTVYFAVENCQESVAKAKELGASVFVDSTSVPELGTFAVLSDPQGGMFCVIAMLQADPMP